MTVNRFANTDATGKQCPQPCPIRPVRPTRSLPQTTLKTRPLFSPINSKHLTPKTPLQQRKSQLRQQTSHRSKQPQSQRTRLNLGQPASSKHQTKLTRTKRRTWHLTEMNKSASLEPRALASFADSMKSKLWLCVDLYLYLHTLI